MGIVLVQVWHRRHKPPFGSLLHIDLRGVGVNHGGELIRCLEETGAFGIRCAIRLLEPFRQVQPVLGGHVLRPGMFKATVVEDHVHHDLETFGVGLVAEPAIVLVGAEAGIHLIIVCGGVAMVGRVTVFRIWRIVLQHRREPEGCYT